MRGFAIPGALGHSTLVVKIQKSRLGSISCRNSWPSTRSMGIVSTSYQCRRSRREGIYGHLCGLLADRIVHVWSQVAPPEDPQKHQLDSAPGHTCHDAESAMPLHHHYPI